MSIWRELRAEEWGELATEARLIRTKPPNDTVKVVNNNGPQLVLVSKRGEERNGPAETRR
jgi:hypothetical protein